MPSFENETSAFETRVCRTPKVTHFRHAMLSDKGRLRATQEDSQGMAKGGDGGVIFCVADGMGGHQAGDVASRAATNACLHEWQATTKQTDIPHRLARCVEAANTSVLSEAASRDMNYGDMGTTIVAVALVRGSVYVAHLGDSRAYLLRGGSLQRLTRDHTEAQELAAAGQIPQEAADHHEYSHVLTRGLGLEPNPIPDIAGPIKTGEDDVFLLCSDGLTGTTSDELIQQILRYLDLEEASKALVDNANFRGGPDNITLTLARIGQRRGPLEEAPEGFILPARAFKRRLLGCLLVAAAACILLTILITVLQ